MSGWINCALGIFWREGLRFVQQRERFLSALVRPLVWLFIFAAGFRSVLGLSIIEPYETYVLYEVYIVPGLCAMIQLFNGMQSSLSMVYDRETGAMRTLLVSPYPRWYLLTSKLVASVIVSVFQVYAFLFVAWFWEVEPPGWGYLAVLPALILSGLVLGAMGLVLSSTIRQLENFAGIMNFVIFPMFFASSAALSALAHRGGLDAVARHRTVQPVHPLRRTDPVRALPADLMDVARGRPRHDDGLPDRGLYRL